MRHHPFASIVGFFVVITASSAFAGAPTVSDPLVGNCGMARSEPGCSDATCEDCVCATDFFCCDTEWDEACVQIAAGQAKKKKNGVGPGSCEFACLAANRSPAPALSSSALVVAVFGLLFLGFLAVRRRRSLAPEI
jgi:hypothetical protein